MQTNQRSTRPAKTAVTAGSAVVAVVVDMAVAAIGDTSDRLVAPFDFKMPSDLAYYVVYPAEAIRRRKIKAFRDWLMTLAEIKTVAA